MTDTTRSSDVRHGVIVVHAFGAYQEADFLDDPVLIEGLIANGEGWRFTDAIWLCGVPKDPDLSYG